MKNSSKLMTIATLLGLGAGLASAATQSFIPQDDAMIFGTSSLVDTGHASGKGPGLFAGADGSLNIKRSLIYFDLSSLNVTATNVELTLWLGQIAGSGGGGGGGGGCGMGCTYPTRNFAIYPVTNHAWSEDNTGDLACGGAICSTFSGQGQGYNFRTCVGATSSSCIDPVSWLYYAWDGNDMNNKWNAATTDQDYGYGSQGTPMATMTMPFPFVVGDALVFTGNSGLNTGFLATVNTWMANSATNLGLMLRSTNLEGSGASFLAFWSKDGAGAANMGMGNGMEPVLTITY